jgi:hypothetical protein
LAASLDLCQIQTDTFTHIICISASVEISSMLCLCACAKSVTPANNGDYQKVVSVTTCNDSLRRLFGPSLFAKAESSKSGRTLRSS